MALSRLVKKLEKVVVDNSPNIMTGIGVAGTLTTAYLAGVAGYKTDRLLYSAQTESKIRTGEELTNKEKFLVVWKLYNPAATTAALTVSAIVGANRVGG